MAVNAGTATSVYREPSMTGQTFGVAYMLPSGQDLGASIGQGTRFPT